MKPLGILLLSIATLLASSRPQQQAEEMSQVFTLAFGSCAHQDSDQHLWDEIVKNNPDVWIWLGDNIYGDTEDLSLLAAKYEKQKSNTGYLELMARAAVIGTWDDHDYGINDGGKEFPIKRESRDLMLDFLDVASDQEVRTHEGVYQRYDYTVSDKTIRIILLDTRYFRDEIWKDTTGGNHYIPNPEGDILGDAQWKWLEAQLSESNADAHVIASSIQVIPEDHGYEKWANFPGARSRLFRLIEKYQPKYTMFLSGDRHIAEYSKIDIGGNTVYEFTSSGLTHSWKQAREEVNQHRVGELIIARNFGIIHFDFDKNLIKWETRGENNAVLGELEMAMEK